MIVVRFRNVAYGWRYDVEWPGRVPVAGELVRLTEQSAVTFVVSEVLWTVDECPNGRVVTAEVLVK